jgi:hypothetical protein
MNYITQYEGQNAIQRYKSFYIKTPFLIYQL